MKIALVLLESPVPFGNAASRWFYVLYRGLVERGHRVTALAACSKPAELEQARDLFPSPRYDFRPFAFPIRTGLGAKWETFRKPYSYMFGPDFRGELDRVLAGGYDVLHLEQLASGWVGLHRTRKAVLNVHFLSSIDLAETEPSRFRWWQIRMMERRLLRAYPRITTLSTRLAEAVRAIAPRSTVDVVPLGIDPANYPYIPDDRRSREPIVSLIGSMNWHPTRSAAVRLLTRLWPGIRSKVPSARLQIVGWEARSALREHLNVPGVAIEENVPDSRPYFERTGVLLYAPGRGSGTKVKLQEAFAYGVPVVTTAEGVEGIPAVDGVHADICEDDGGLIDRTVGLLTDVGRQNRQRSAARKLLEEFCGPRATLDAVEHVHAEIVSRR